MHPPFGSKDYDRSAIVGRPPVTCMNDVEIITLEDRDRWIAEHRMAGLPSQSWNYAWALSASGFVPFLAIVRTASGRMLLPFHERRWHDSTDVTTLIGHSGALIFPASPAPLSLWSEYAQTRGWVAGYIQLSTSVDLSGRPISGELVAVNDWFVLDLRAERIFDSFSEIIRRKVKRCANESVGLVDDPSLLSKSLTTLFPASMARLGARGHYQFSAETLVRWAQAPEALIVGARADDSIEAVSVFLVAGDQAEYHINGCTERGRNYAAWLIWNAI